MEQLNLSTLAPAKGAKHRRKRVGFGEGSGLGKTSGKGTKGHKARSGFKQTRGFEGGQMPLHRRLPKFGFTSRKRLRGENIYTLVSIKKLEELATDGKATLEQFRSWGLISRADDKIKILGGTEATKAITVEVHAISASARDSILKAGGSIQLIPAKSKATAEVATA
jgi:large subunit ribosomal protein L15